MRFCEQNAIEVFAPEIYQADLFLVLLNMDVKRSLVTKKFKENLY